MCTKQRTGGQGGAVLKELWLGRTEESKQGTFGHLIAGPHHWHTGELPWLDNEVGRSCIPTGSYIIEPDHTGVHQVYRILNVPGRTLVELHVANWMGDEAEGYFAEVDGCIGLGHSRGRGNPSRVYDGAPDINQEMINHSSLAIAAFKKYMNGEIGRLNIEHKVSII